MRINNNITADNANRQLGITSRNKSSTTERLSSGMRVNRSADDAASLAISEKMRTQIRGLNRASLNIQDGASLLQVGDGALQSVHDKMQRLRELAVQAANGTNEDLDRAAIQLEFDQLTSEINAVVGETNFNGMQLFDGSVGSTRAWSFGVESYVYDPASITMGAPDFPSNGIRLFPWTAPANLGVTWTPATGLSTLADVLNGGVNPTFPQEGLFAIQISTPANGIFNFILDFAHANSDGSMSGSGFQDALRGLLAQAGPAFADIQINVNYVGNTLEIVFPRHAPPYENALAGVMGQVGDRIPSVHIGIGYGVAGGPGTFHRASMNQGTRITNNPAIENLYIDDDPATIARFGGPLGAIFYLDPPSTLFPRQADTPRNDFRMDVNFADGRSVPINLVPGHFPDVSSFVTAQAPAFAAAGFMLTEVNGRMMLETLDTGPHLTFAAPPAPAITSTPAALAGWLGYSDAETEVVSSARVLDDYLWIQSGANSGDGIGIQMPRLCARSLGLAIWPFDREDPQPTFIAGVTIDNFATTANVTPPEPPPSPMMYSLSVMSHEDASATLTALTNAINIISTERAHMGAQQNRLDHSRANVDNTSENLQASESRIRDADMAAEMTTLVRQQILSQSGTSMLAHANALPQGVLQLLG